MYICNYGRHKGRADRALVQGPGAKVGPARLVGQISEHKQKTRSSFTNNKHFYKIIFALDRECI